MAAVLLREAGWKWRRLVVRDLHFRRKQEEANDLGWEFGVQNSHRTIPDSKMRSTSLGRVETLLRTVHPHLIHHFWEEIRNLASVWLQISSHLLGCSPSLLLPVLNYLCAAATECLRTEGRRYLFLSVVPEVSVLPGGEAVAEQSCSHRCAKEQRKQGMRSIQGKTHSKDIPSLHSDLLLLSRPPPLPFTTPIIPPRTRQAWVLRI